MKADTDTGLNVSICPFCQGSLQAKLVSEAIPYLTPQGEVLLHAEVPYEFCSTCGYEGFGEAGERVRTEVIYRHVGRLTPWEIVSIRESLGLSQAQFADRLGVGRASLERWERGAKMQNQSMDNLILLLSRREHKDWLDNERFRRLKVGTATTTIVCLDRFRALRTQDSGELVARQSKFRLRRLA